jgi:hypothetical protein
VQRINELNATDAMDHTKLDLFEHILKDSASQTLVKGQAFFIPPVTGAYSFLCAGDDVMQLNGTHAGGNRTTLCSAPSWTLFREWGQLISQVLYSSTDPPCVSVALSLPAQGPCLSPASATQQPLSSHSTPILHPSMLVVWLKLPIHPQVSPSCRRR